MKKTNILRMIPRLLFLLVALLLVGKAWAGGASTPSDDPWLYSFSGFLTNPVVSTVLLIVGVLGMMIEAVTFSLVAGIIGLLSLSLFFMAHIIAGLAPAWVVGVFILGIVFVLVELLVLPGHGVTGILGILCIGVSLFIAMMHNPVQAGISLFITFVVSIGIFIYVLKYLPKSKVWKSLTLETRQKKDEGYSSHNERTDLEGAMGVATTDLRPGGIALINGERVDVVADGEFIKKDSPVVVRKVEGIKIIVAGKDGSW